LRSSGRRKATAGSSGALKDTAAPCVGTDQTQMGKRRSWSPGPVHQFQSPPVDAFQDDDSSPGLKKPLDTLRKNSCAAGEPLEVIVSLLPRLC
jgi:hypothetical protein